MATKPSKPVKTTARAEAAPRDVTKLIAEAAYYRAQERGFAPGHELDDWIAAEAEIRGRFESSAR